MIRTCGKQEKALLTIEATELESAELSFEIN